MKATPILRSWDITISCIAALALTALAITQSASVWFAARVLPGTPTLPAQAWVPRPLSEDASVMRCGVWLPPLASVGDAATLIARVEEIIEAPTTPFPFQTSAGYYINPQEGKAIDEATAARVTTRAGGKRDTPGCAAQTYDGPTAKVLGGLFAPGGAGAVGAGDAVLDLGAGIGKVLVVAALVSNASMIRGIELGASRFEEGCRVLQTLEREFEQRPELAAPGPRRRVELIRGDLFALPGSFFTDMPQNVVMYSYCNCYPYQLVGQIFKYAADLERDSVRLLASKEPLRDMPTGLRRAGFTGTIMSAYFERLRPGVGLRPESFAVRPSPGLFRGAPRWPSSG